MVVGVADEPLREALRRILEREGAAVAPYADAKSLLAAVEPHTPDVCIVDVDLPGLPGEELIARIRQGRAGMPVLLVSAHLFPLESKALEGLPILPLPFRRSELLDILQRILSISGAASPP